ncbi:hypothetical protein [Micromonospora sp. NBC_01813]|nr:hypothetical protein [Micromonospora sp. NBC_01813]WSA11351.1 hypothetical protein OG958_11545 [Micromonospora sp. NBC_01813]
MGGSSLRHRFPGTIDPLQDSMADPAGGRDLRFPAGEKVRL